MNKEKYINPNIISFSEKDRYHYVLIKGHSKWKVKLLYYKCKYTGYDYPIKNSKYYLYLLNLNNVVGIYYSDRFYNTKEGYKAALKKCIIKNNVIMNKLKKCILKDKGELKSL